MSLKICAISDVHGKWNKLTIPECDILISAGDYSFVGEKHMVKDFHAWLNKQEAGHIVSVQGNHEVWVEKNFNEAKELAKSVCPAVHFIDEGPVEIEGLKIWGSAITPFFHNWAWNRERDKIQKHWDLIPNDIDILITHGPPYGMGDQLYYADGVTPHSRVGCYKLMEKVEQIPSLKHHIFGHIHSGHGHYEFNGKHFWNASICDEQYMPTNDITIIEM